MPDFNPSDRYPDLTADRLSIVANILARERDDAALDHHPERGETEFSLGVSAWERTKSAIIAASQKYSWLRIADGDTPGPSPFTFQIGVYPIRFFHGTAEEMPTRYLFQSEIEQLVIPFRNALPSGHILRFAVDTNAIHRTTTIELIEVDKWGENVWRHPVAFSATTDVVPFPTTQKAGVDLGAPTVEVLKGVRKTEGE
jgi:hypothetical protein